MSTLCRCRIDSKNQTWNWCIDTRIKPDSSSPPGGAKSCLAQGIVGPESTEEVIETWAAAQTFVGSNISRWRGHHYRCPPTFGGVLPVCLTQQSTKWPVVWGALAEWLVAWLAQVKQVQQHLVWLVLGWVTARCWLRGSSHTLISGPDWDIKWWSCWLSWLNSDISDIKPSHLHFTFKCDM